MTVIDNRDRVIVSNQADLRQASLASLTASRDTATADTVRRVLGDEYSLPVAAFNSAI